MTDQAKKYVRYFVDYAGLAAFLITLVITRSAVTATWALVAGAGLALAAGLILEKRLAPMALVTFVLALFFGGLTLFFHDDRFIKMKPTVLYVGFGIFLLAGLARGKNPLRTLMGDAFHLPDPVVRTLTWRYAVFFLALAAANELVWRTQSTIFWGFYKFPGTVIVIFLFSLSQAPLMMKHMPEEEPAPPRTTLGAVHGPPVVKPTQKRLVLPKRRGDLMAKTKSGTKGGIAALERSPSHLLHKALQKALDIYADEFGAGAITQRQYAVLAASAEREGATQADLVRITGIDRSTLADMATRMIAKGLLERERSTLDARANAVRLTEAGRLALEDAGPKMAAADSRLLKLISGGGRRETFVDLLHDLVRKDDGEPAAKKVKAVKPPKLAKSLKPPKLAKAEKPSKKAKKKSA